MYRVSISWIIVEKLGLIKFFYNIIVWFLCVVFYEFKIIGINNIVYKSLVLFYFIGELLFFYLGKIVYFVV